jgi:spore coat protein A
MAGISRRGAIKLGAVGGAAVLLPIGSAAAGRRGVTDRHEDSPRVPTFAVPLRIPTELEPTSGPSPDTDYYTIRQRVARVPILPGFAPSSVWAFEGEVPGPTITQRTGRDVVVRFVNELGVPTTTHLHGGDVPPESDGHPTDLVLPGQFKDHVYPGVHAAADLWYHDHAIHQSGRNVWMGLAGFYRVVDDVEQALPLPRRPFDIPLVITDRFFLRDGSLAYPVHGDEPERQGAFGEVVMVNGTPRPFFRVQRRRYRFRLLNASNARIYRLRLSTDEPLVVISTEGGMLPNPVPTGDVLLSPSERIGVVVDFSRYPLGTSIVLRNTFGDVPGDPFDVDATREVMRFDVVEDAVDDSHVPDDLVPLPEDVDPAQSVATRQWEFDRRHGEWTINGRPWDEDRIDARPRLGTVEIWRLVNRSGGWLHPIHPHLVEFLMLNRTRRPLLPYERGLKDTVLLGPNEEAEVAIRWNHFRGVYAFHCHNVEHEDNDMMTQFEVI